MKKQKKITLGYLIGFSVMGLFIFDYFWEIGRAIFSGRFGIEKLLIPIVLGSLAGYFVYKLPERFILSKKERENQHNNEYWKRKKILLNTIIVIFGVGFASGNITELIRVIGDGRLLYGIGGLLFTLVFTIWILYFLFVRIDRYRSKRAKTKQKTPDSEDG